MFYFDNFGPTD